MNENCFLSPLWPVLHADNHLLALYKPAGLLVQGDETGQTSLLELGKAWLKQKYQKPGRVFLGMVHRLDRPVAGVVLFCRTSKAAARISEQFRTGNVRKHYLAVVEGVMKEASGRLVHQVEKREDRSSRIVSAKSPLSREARLSYRVVDVCGYRSLVEILLETGRKHQIRLQMAHMGNPVLGDVRYGASAPLPQQQIALLARELTVEHPVHRGELSIRSPLPQGWPWPKASILPDAPPWNYSDFSCLSYPDGQPFNAETDMKTPVRTPKEILRGVRPHR